MDIRSHLIKQANELGEATEQLDEQYAWAKARGYNELARAYLVGQAELLRRVADVNSLINTLDDAQ